MWTATIFCLVTLLSAISAQPDCNALGFEGSTEPFPGTGLSVCAANSDQCCSENYLESIQMRVRRRLEQFLGKEFDDVIEDYQDEVEDLLDYFTDYFPEILLRNLPFSDVFDHSDPLIRRILRNLIEHFEIDDDDDNGEEVEEGDEEDSFNVRDFVDKLLEGIFESLGRDFEITSRGNVVSCIARVFRDLLDNNVVGRITSQLQQVRRGITALTRIGRFLRNQRARLDGVTILEQCVRRLVQISYCPRCTQQTPPLCFRTCNALARACYSPYFTALNGQYRQLWSRVQRIVRTLNATITELFDEEGVLLDRATVLREILSECGVRMNDRMGGSGSPRERKQTDGDMGDGEDGGEDDRKEGEEDRDEGNEDGDEDGDEGDDTTGDSDSSFNAKQTILNSQVIPFAIVDDLFELNGAFAYGRRIAEGLRFCREALIDDSASCPANREDQPYCEGVEFCTSQCFCTDGVRLTRDDETDQVFDGSDVADQGDNPVIDLDVGELQDVMASITSMGDPVQGFLTSDEFTSVDPSAQDPIEGPGGGGGSAAGVSASLSVLLLAVLMITLL